MARTGRHRKPDVPDRSGRKMTDHIPDTDHPVFENFEGRWGHDRPPPRPIAEAGRGGGETSITPAEAAPQR